MDKLIEICEEKLQPYFKQLEEIALFNQNKVLQAFKDKKIALRHFNGTNGYGYDDNGRDTLAKVYAQVFDAEKAIVSPNIVSGTHALTLGLFGILRPNDIFLSITGKPYDTLDETINGSQIGSLKDFGVRFESIELENGIINYPKIKDFICKNTVKMVYLQRSRGYEWRNALSISEIKKAVDFLREIGFNGCIFVDNCYGEFVEKQEPTSVGADVIAGSLIKNPGGGLAVTGGYLAGKEKYITLIENRLTSPSIGGEVGSYAYGYQYFYQGFFIAPHVVLQALKGNMLFGAVMKEKGYETSPNAYSIPYDITRSVKLPTEQKLIDFIQSIQSFSPVDSFVTLYPWDMPGYNHQVIMAAGCFVQGSSLELSADAPIKEPYIAYLQGGLTYEHCKIVLNDILNKI